MSTPAEKLQWGANNKVEIAQLFRARIDASQINGPSINTQGYSSATLLIFLGNVIGGPASPLSESIVFEESDDDVVFSAVPNLGPVINAVEDSIVQYDIHLGTFFTKKHVRTVSTVQAVGATSVGTGVVLLLYDAKILPVQ